MKIDKIRKLPVFERAIKSIFQELGETMDKHSTITNLVRHVPKHERRLTKDVVKAFIRIGYLRKHRTDTFSWTKDGLNYAKSILQNEN